MNKLHSSKKEYLLRLSGFLQTRWLLITSISCFMPCFIQAQTSAPPVDSYINFQGGQNIAFVSIADSINVSEIEVQIGGKSNADDILSHVYIFDQPTGIPNGLSYSREGLNLYLGMGAVELPPAFSVKVRLKNSSGNWSSWIEYVSN